MSRLIPGALWRAAPLRLLRTPGWALLVLVAAALFVASVVAPPIFVASARATALDDGLRAAADAPYGPESADLRVSWDAVLPPASEAVLMDRLSGLDGYGEPTVGAVGVGQSRTRRGMVAVGDTLERSVLWYHDGAVAALGGDEDADGVWLEAGIARRLGLSVGDPFRIGLVETFLGTEVPKVPTVLAGTYETGDGSALPRQVADLPDSSRWLLPPDPDTPDRPTPLAIAGHATFDRLAIKVHESPLYSADLVLGAGITPDGAAVAVDDMKDLSRDAYDGATTLAPALAQGEPAAARLTVASGLPVITEAAERTATSAQEQIRPYAVGGQVLAGLLLVSAVLLLGRSRRREQLLVSSLGLRPIEVSGLAVLELLVVAGLAVPAGLGLAWVGLVVAGPQDVGWRIVLTSDDWSRAVGVAAAAVVMVAVTVGLAAAVTDRMSLVSRLGSGRRALPWGAALLAATGVVAIAVLSVDVAQRSSTPLTMVLPVLVVASVAMLVTRAVGWLRTRRPGRARAGSPRWLATRRTGPVVREVTALAAVIAVGLGLFGYTLTVRRGVDEGVADKTAALAGASTTIEVADDFRGGRMRRAVTPPTDGTTIVWRRTVALPPVFGDVPLMAIDTRTFADVATWGESGVLDDARDLLPELEEKHAGIPVILAGASDLDVGDRGMLFLSAGPQIPFQVIGVTEALPGSALDSGGLTVVVSTRRLFRLLTPTPLIDPRRRGASSTDAGAFSSSVWSASPPSVLRADLDRAGVSTDGEVTTADQERILAGLVASTWAAAYLLALGGVVLALALAAALVLALRLADRDATSDVLLQRMGYRAGELSRARAWEAAYAGATAAAAAVLAGAVLVVVPTMIDAVTAVPPTSRPRPSPADLVGVAGAVVVMVCLAWSAGGWRARRRNPGEVLRGGG